VSVFHACAGFLSQLLRGHRLKKWPSQPAFERLEFETLEDRIVPSSLASVARSPDAPLFGSYSGDFNGDGKTDIATFTSAQQWTVMLSDGTRLSAPQVWADWSGQGTIHKIVVGDFNGDGKTDVAAWFGFGAWQVGISTGQQFTTSIWESPGRTPYVAAVAGDFNGDGKADIAGLTRTGALDVSLSTGQAFATTTWAVGLTGNWTRLLVGDFNGDGRDDLALLQNNAWQMALSTGDGAVLQWWGVWDQPMAAQRVAVGDFNGDGIDDVAGITRAGRLEVGTSTGNGFLVTSWGDNLGQAQRLLAGDFDGNGRDDFAIVWRRSVWIAYSTGTALARWQQVGWIPVSSWPHGWTGDVDGDHVDDLITHRGNSWYFVRSDGVSVPEARLAYIRYPGEHPPFLSNSAWSSNFPRIYVDATSMSLLQGMDFNSETTFDDYVYTFKDELRRWQGEAAALGIGDGPQFRDFLQQKLDAKFIQVRPLLASRYPGLDDTKYRLLMTMNLVSGYFVFGPGTPYRRLNLWDLMRQTVGNCGHLAQLVRELALIQGIPATHYAIIENFSGPFGQFGTGHNLVLADGLLIDAEINAAFDIGSLNDLESIPGGDRLGTLLRTGHVYGFYNWLNSPPIRNEQLSRGQDGGVIAYYYYWYFLGLDLGNAQIWKIPPIKP
jgi:hypothetical protein